MFIPKLYQGITFPFRLVWQYVALVYAFVRYVLVASVYDFFEEIENKVNPDPSIQPRCSSGRHERYREYEW